LVARGEPQGSSQRNGRPAPFAAWTEPGLQTVWIFAFPMNLKRNDHPTNTMNKPAFRRAIPHVERVFHSYETMSICKEKNKTRTLESENPQ
jgi:hypothetical protein